MTNVKKRDTSQHDAGNRFERRAGSVIMKNNSMAELYNQCANQIAKPSNVNMRNSVNGGVNFSETAASSPSKTCHGRTLQRRSGSID